MQLRYIVLLIGVSQTLAQPSPSPSPSGNIVKHSVQADGIKRTFYAQYPPSAMTPSSGWPVVFSFHGWCGSASAEASYDGPLRTFGAQKAIIVHGEGWPEGSQWQSWNGGGSSGANAAGGMDGPICEPATARSSSHCYDSCKEKGYCTTSGGPNVCRWSHCKDDVAAVLGALEVIRSYTAKAGGSLDNSKIFATGDSNGAMFMYELASDPRSAKVFSALAPVSGLPHNGFNRGTINTNIRFLMIAGTKDSFVYPFPNVPKDPTESYGAGYGWYYSSWINTTNLWAHQKSLPSSANKTLVSKSHGQGLTCYGWSTDSTPENAQVGTCFYKGTHDSPPNNARKMIWNFFGFTNEDSEQLPITV